MTVEELSQIYYINKEIQSLQLELAQIRETNFYKGNVISDMPRGNSKEDVSVEYVNTIMMLENLIHYSLIKLQYERQKIEKFIDMIEDAKIRSIVRLRSVNNMSWYEIGDELGIDRRTASKKFYDYF